MGQSKPERRAWHAMRERVSNPDYIGAKNYSGRGITMCERWQSFENFFADMGPCPPGHSLERKNNDDGYHPSNCKWATREEQNNNTRANHKVTFNGRTQTVAQWAEELGVSWNRIASRLRQGDSVEVALTAPNKRQQSFLEFEGQTKSVSEWCRERGLPFRVVLTRLRSGWSVERALTQPAKKYATKV